MIKTEKKWKGLITYSVDKLWETKMLACKNINWEKH